MPTYDDKSGFVKLLIDYREQAGLSQNSLAKHSGIDASHLNRIERGLKNPPKKRTIIAFAYGLGLDDADTSRLLQAGGYTAMENQKPGYPDFLASGDGTKQLKNIFDMLNDSDIPQSKRTEIGKNIHSYAEYLYQKAKAKK